MSPVKANPIPLPAAVLALSVAVCIGAASPADAASLRAGQRAQAEQRQSLEHLLDAIQQAAKKLTEKLDGQVAFVRADTARLAAVFDEDISVCADASPLVDLHLREALLNLPPPSC